MIFDDLKKANMEAMKAHDQNARGVYSVLINKCMLKSVELKTQNASLTDGDTLVLINKTIKELDEEYETYKKAGREEQASVIAYQKGLLEKYLPKLMSEEEIESEITKLDDKSLKGAITDMLHSLGIPSHIKGYSYIRDSISLMYKNPSMIGAITKELYPEVASMYDTTSSRVERAIRHAIEVSWSRGDYDLMESLFGHSVDYDRAKPTNSEFIATLADRLRLDNCF